MDSQTTIERGWGHPADSPARRFAEFFSAADYAVEHPHWIDHAYRETLDDGRLLFICEPYDLNAAGLDEILETAREGGWRLHIDGCGVHHTTTVRVTFERSPA